MIKLCVGLLTYCDSGTHPERYKIFSECLPTLKNIAGPDVYIFAIDNGSSDDVIRDLKECQYLDEVYQATENLYDILAVNLLIRKAEELNSEYVMHLEDDFFFYRGNFLNSCIEFFDTNKECGYLRILKYDIHNMPIYDKLSGHKDTDRSNCQRHYNNISKELLQWTERQRIGDFDFYTNNWHWYNFANICRTEVFKRIVPTYSTPPLQALEGEMMKNYHMLDLKTGVMDQGVVEHVGTFDKKTSLRLSFKNPETHEPKNQFPVVTMKSINAELDKIL